jgi:hypothetical protein
MLLCIIVLCKEPGSTAQHKGSTMSNITILTEDSLGLVAGGKKPVLRPAAEPKPCGIV